MAVITVSGIGQFHKQIINLVLLEWNFQKSFAREINMSWCSKTIQVVTFIIHFLSIFTENKVEEMVFLEHFCHCFCIEPLSHLMQEICWILGVAQFNMTAYHLQSMALNSIKIWQSVEQLLTYQWFYWQTTILHIKVLESTPSFYFCDRICENPTQSCKPKFTVRAND